MNTYSILSAAQHVRVDMQTMQGCRKISVPIIRLIGKQLLKCDTTPSVVDHSHIAPSQHRLHLLDGFIFPSTSHWIRRAGGLHPGFMSLPLQRDERQIETGSDGGEWSGVGGEMHVTAVLWSLFTKKPVFCTWRADHSGIRLQRKSNNWFGARTAGCCARIKNVTTGVFATMRRNERFIPRARGFLAHEQRRRTYSYNSGHASFKCVETYTSEDKKKSQLGLFFFLIRTFFGQHLRLQLRHNRCGRGDVINLFLPFVLGAPCPPARLQEQP